MQEEKEKPLGESTRALQRAEAQDKTDDDSLIRWMLSLSPEERLAMAQGFVDSVAALDLARAH